MSSAFNFRTALRDATTQTVAVSALAVGDLVFYGTSGPDPWRVRHLDRFPGGKVNIVASPGAILDKIALRQLGVFAPTDTVKRVVLV